MPLSHVTYENVRCHATFGSWSSHNAWLQFKVLSDTDTDGPGARVKMHFIKSWGQLPKGRDPHSVPTWRHPHLNEADWAKVKLDARRMHFKRLDRARVRGERNGLFFQVPRNSLQHPEHLCERCLELAFPCTRCLEDCMGEIFTAPAKRLRSRRGRLDAGDRKTLYHQTTADIARMIVESQVFRPGTRGSLGAAIYFAETIEATDLKTTRRPVVLACTVKLGRVKTLHGPAPGMTTETMLNESYDSIFAPFFRSGPEWAIFLPDQISDIRIVRR